MSAKKKFDEYLGQIESLRHASPGAELTAALRAALREKNNYLVSKAAANVEYHRVAELEPELLTALERFYRDPVKTDPQCWAKAALVRALAVTGHSEGATFLRASAHTQLEPVWGGLSDTAGPMRAAAILALVGCGGVPDLELMRALTERLMDVDHTVRVAAARGFARVGLPEAALPLRLKALVGDGEPEVIGACFSGILALEDASGFEFVQRFAAADSDAAEVRSEAILAIGLSRASGASAFLRELWPRIADPALSGVTLTALAATQDPDALEFLITLVDEEPPPTAGAALRALDAARLSSDQQARLTEIRERRRLM